MKHFLLFTFICLTAVTRGQNSLDFNFDYAQFKYDSTSNYLEIYYTIYPNQFSLKETAADLSVNGLLNIKITQLNGVDTLVNKNWDISRTFADSSEYVLSSSLLGVVGYKIAGGNYNLLMRVEDLNDSSNSRTYEEKIDISPYPNNRLAVSNIQLASRILNDNVNKESIFYKNTFEVYPNPSSIYSKTYPVLYYYSELYNLEAANRDSLRLLKLVYNSKKDKIYESRKDLTSSNESIVEVGVVNLKNFPTDAYRFELVVTDKYNKEISYSGKRFFLLNPDIKKEGIALNKRDYMSSEFGVLSLEECDDMFDKSKIIASSNEVDQYEVLDSLSEKREFLFNFWSKRDDVPSTPINEFKVNYFSRIGIAFERYSTVSKPGFKTDRGRVYARFGEPDEIERHPNETDTKPYEIWFYNQIEGGVYFIFGDYTGFGDYELLHSTMRGELQDPQWMRRIRTN